MKKISIKCYGLFSDFENQINQQLDDESVITLGDLKKRIATQLKTKLGENFKHENTLRNDCAFGIDGKFCDDDFMVNNSMEISILPPVCGG